MEDVLETSTSPLIHQNVAMPRNKNTNFLLATFPAISAIFLLASFATAPLQMLTLFNSCPSLRSSPLANITCDDSTTSPVVGTVCKVTCPVGYPSTGQLESTCSWTGRWTNDNLDCDATPGLVIIGKSATRTSKSFAEVYFPNFIVNQTIDQFPYMLHYGMSAYVDGKLLACGGYDGANVRSSCYQLNRNGSWDAAPSMPQEHSGASSAVIDQGSSLWILGGMDSSRNPYSSTFVWKSSSSSWVDGPSLTSPRVFHCSVTMPNQDVLVIGGVANVDLSLVERYSSGQWSTEAPLHQARHAHSCSHVWMEDCGPIAIDAHSGLSGVVVAGGAILDGSGVHSVSSVELLYKGVWLELPQLPVIHKPNWRMSLLTSLVWLPLYGLNLVGGCWVNHDDGITWCTTKLWRLRSKGWAPNNTYHWAIAPLEKLEMAMFRGNGEVAIPSTYFN